MDLVPERLTDDCLVLTRVGCALVDGIADVNPIVEDLVEHPSVDGLAVPVDEALGSEFPDDDRRRAAFDKALEDALQKQPWDPSVKGLTAVPQVLSMMSEKLDLTQQMGDAFLAQPKELMDAVQKLRQKASAQGNLKDTKEQKVITEQVATQTVIKIEPADPQVVYVPTYNPAVVYGTWAYPAYPPYAYYPPAYYGAYAGAGLVGFTAGVIVGSALWGNCNWGGGNVDVDVNRNSNFTRNVNRTEVAASRSARVQERQAGGRSQWQHNPENRQGVQYRDHARRIDGGWLIGYRETVKLWARGSLPL